LDGLKLFWSFGKISVHEILDEKSVYLNAFFALIFLDNMETIYSLLGVSEESGTFIALSVTATLFSFVVLSQVVLIQKRKKGGTGELKYFVPTFLLYNLYYSFLFLTSLLLLVFPGYYIIFSHFHAPAIASILLIPLFLPGLFFLFYFSMVPFIAVLDDEISGKFFKKSISLVKKKLPLVACTSLAYLAVELAAILITVIQDPMAKIIFKLILSIPDAFFTLVITVITVKVYYYLVNLPNSATDNTQSAP
jgi:hypothetical protein